MASLKGVQAMEAVNFPQISGTQSLMRTVTGMAGFHGKVTYA